MAINKKRKEIAKDGLSSAEKLANYYKANQLDPEKDWSKHKVHGPIVTKLKKRVQTATLKVKAGIGKTPTKKPDVKPVKVTKVEKEPKRQTASYDYPMVDGQPMSPELRKKYRGAMRAFLKANMTPEEAAEKALIRVQEIPTPKVKTKALEFKAKKNSTDSENSSEKVKKKVKLKDILKKRSKPIIDED